MPQNWPLGEDSGGVKVKCCSFYDKWKVQIAFKLTSSNHQKSNQKTKLKIINNYSVLILQTDVTVLV